MLNIIETIIKNCIYISFPLLVYLLYIAYNKNIGRKENDLVLDFTLMTSFYLVIRFADKLPLLSFNSILFIAYIKKRSICSYIMTAIIVIYYVVFFDFNFYLTVLEYLSYYFIYLSYKDETKIDNSLINMLIFFKSFWFSFTVYYYGIVSGKSYIITSKIAVYLFILYVICCFCFYLFKLGEKIMNYHMTLKELEQEKQIRTSLFKITHEIKNPIAVCKGYLDMFDVNNKEHSIKYIPIIREEIRKTLNLLQDFLSMTIIKINKDILDINLLIETVITNMKLLLKENKIKLNVKLIDDEIFIDGDYNRLNQVLVNVIKNSIEALENIDDACIEIYTKLDDNYVYLYVEDNGIGISDEDLVRIKEAFFTTKSNGTGLGLSLSNEIINAHNGKMNFTSQKNKGTIVEIKLPL